MANVLSKRQEASRNKTHLLEARSLTLKVYHRAGAFEVLLAYTKRCPEASFTKQDQLLIDDTYFFLKQYKDAISKIFLNAKSTNAKSTEGITSPDPLQMVVNSFEKPRTTENCYLDTSA